MVAANSKERERYVCGTELHGCGHGRWTA